MRRWMQRPTSTIKKFSHAKDTIDLSSVVFLGLDEGPLKGRYFRDGKKAKDGTDHVLYDVGRLLYDVDGKGGAEPVLFAKLKGDPDIGPALALALGPSGVSTAGRTFGCSAFHRLASNGSGSTSSPELQSPASAFSAFPSPVPGRPEKRRLRRSLSLGGTSIR